MAPETVNMDLDLDEDGEYYGRFIVKLREKLAHHPQGRYIAEHPWLEGHPLLPVQKHPRQPSRWVHINVVAHDKETSKAMRTTLAVRDDNVYLIGFKNGEGKWYEFGLENQSMRFIEGSTFLGCDVGYGDLANLHHVGKYPAIDAVHRLSGYGGVGAAAADTADTIRRDLALMCVMICESARMMPHFNTVTQGWDQLQDGRELGAQHAEYIKNWSSMSRRLLSMQDQSMERNHLLTVFHLLLNSPDPNPMRVGKSVLGRPLLEVFHVRIFGPIDTIGTIAVFDGKRGQIIYNHTQGTTSGPLTGPYRAISAEGSVMIQVHGIISAGTESRDVIAEIMLWNCYADGVDKALERHINTATYNGTRLPLAKVKYAVWSDAVEATMEVSLLLPAITSVHGTITAFCGSTSANEVVLFSRQEGDKVELVPSVANSMVPLELGRSVVVVPLRNRYQCLRIYMTLRAQTPNNGSDVRPLQGYYFFHLHESTGKIQFHYGSDFFVPVGWTGLSSNDVSASASRQTTHQSGKQQQIKVQVKITSPGFHVSHPKLDSQQHMNMY